MPLFSKVSTSCSSSVVTLYNYHTKEVSAKDVGNTSRSKYKSIVAVSLSHKFSKLTLISLYRPFSLLVIGLRPFPLMVLPSKKTISGAHTFQKTKALISLLHSSHAKVPPKRSTIPITSITIILPFLLKFFIFFITSSF